MLTKGLVTRDPTHKMTAEWLKHAGNEALFKRLGLPEGARVLQFAATNVGNANRPDPGKGVHAEDFIIRQVKAALRMIAFEHGLPLTTTQQLDALLEVRGRGGLLGPAELHRDLRRPPQGHRRDGQERRPGPVVHGGGQGRRPCADRGDHARVQGPARVDQA